MRTKFNLILRSKDASLRTPDVFSGATWHLPPNLELQQFDRVRLAWCSSVYGMYDTDLGTTPSFPFEIGVECAQLAQTGSYDTAVKGPSQLLGRLVIDEADETTGKVCHFAAPDHNVWVPVRPGSFETTVSLQLVSMLTGAPFPTLEEWVVCLEFQ